MKGFEVKIDNNACKGPLECAKCMQECPTLAFKTYPSNRKRGEVCDKWLLVWHWFDCNHCGICEETCPEGAISIQAKY